jgi:tetratricopeptide (TPR) repeat protein
VNSKTVICEAELVIAIEQALPSDTVVVTFNDRGSSHDTLGFWADDVLHDLGLSAIGIVTPSLNWYPREAMNRVVSAVLPRIGSRRVLTIGHGHGGYGALKFSRQLQAAVALAISPQWSIDPADVAAFDSRFIKAFDKALGNGRRIEQSDLSACAFVAFDNLSALSAAHATRLGELEGLHLVRAPFFMGERGALRTERKSVARLIELCARPHPPAGNELRSIIRAGRAESKSYRSSLLRDLVSRTAKSRHHSVIFASRLLAREQDEAVAFHRSLLSHAAGKPDAARSQLATAGARRIAATDLLPLIKLTRELGFPEAELAIANEIRTRLSHNTAACLSAVGTLSRRGQEEAAVQELLRLTTNPDACNSIARFIEHATELKSPEILENLLESCKGSSTRITLLFALVEGHVAKGARKIAFAKLMELQTLCSDSPERLRGVANLFVALGEFSTAIDILKRLLGRLPDDYLISLEIVDVKMRIVMAKDRRRIHLELKKIHAELRAIMKGPLPALAWERASQLYDSMGELADARRAIKKALKLSRPTFDMRRQYAVLLARTFHTRAARRELERLFSENAQNANNIRILCGLARWMQNQELARSLAEAQFALEPEAPESCLFLARQLNLQGDQASARELLRALCERERRQPFISNPQRIRLAQELYEAGDLDLARAALDEATARDPGNATVRKLTATFALSRRLGNTIEPAGTPPTPPDPARVSLMTRIRNFF